MGVLIRFVVNAVALAVAAFLVEGISVSGIQVAGIDAADSTNTDRAVTLCIVAAVFGLVNVIVRPVVKLLALPLIILTLGLAIFVINALMLMLTSWISEQLDVPFHVDGFVAALIGALIITVVAWVLELVLPD